MAGYLTTHVLDTARGCPAAGLVIDLYRLDGETRTHLRTLSTNADSRTDAQILPEADFEPGEELTEAFELFPDTLQDPMVNGQTSEVSSGAVMLPFFGLTELPMLLAALGNFTVEEEDKNLVWGTGVFAPMMLGLKRDDDDPGISPLVFLSN